MTQSSTGAYQEHHFRRVIPGDVETARRRLSDALEEFNYIVLSEQPLQARRSAQKNIILANVLEYDIRLTIALKSISPVSTVATFDYEVQYLFAKGERFALEREAEAIIALASLSNNKSVCPACSTENLGAVRFCRACGTPVAHNRLPAEIEVMRLTADASGAEVEVTSGIVISVVTLLVALPLILLGSSKAAIAGWIVLGAGQLLSLFFLLGGMLRLHRMVNPVAAQDAQLEVTRALSMQERAALPPQPVSVVEGTTELMALGDEEKIPSAVKNISRDTGDMD